MVCRQTPIQFVLVRWRLCFSCDLVKSLFVDNWYGKLSFKDKWKKTYILMDFYHVRKFPSEILIFVKANFNFYLQVLDDIIHHLSASNLKFLTVHVGPKICPDCEGRTARPYLTSTANINHVLLSLYFKAAYYNSLYFWLNTMTRHKTVDRKKLLMCF